MTDSSSPQNCPKCGAQIPDEAPAGLCPKCVLGGAAAPTAGSAPNVVSGGRRVAPPSPEEIAPHFPELEIDEIIGAGGMGAVYKARQPKLDRMVALKILTQDLAEDPAFVERFNREARVLAKLSHPNIVTVFDFGTAGPFCFLVMELVDGVNLRQAMHSGGGFTPAESLALVGDICDALGFAHEEGVMHRDIKPENILIDSRGRVKIADFGIAKLVGASEPNDVTLTMHGAVLGSPQYMAPEQIETPGDIDQRADIYSLGVVFYELLTGELPLGRFAPPSEKAPMDARIDEIVMRTLEKEREARFQSAGEVETRIEAIATSPQKPVPAATEEAAQEPHSGEPEVAKFATAAAICTGLSLLFATIAFFTLPILFREYGTGGERPMIGGERAMSMAYAALAVGIPALLGMFFGFRALGEIRRSGGRKVGLGSAMFGALTVPVLIALASSVTMVVYALRTGSPTTLLLVSVSLVAVSGIAAAWGLIRNVNAWARGDSSLRGKSSASKVAWPAALAGAAAVSALIIFNMEPDDGRVLSSEKTLPATPPPNAGDPTASGSGGRPAMPRQEFWDMHWNEGSPDFIGQLSVPRGHNAEIQLLRVDSTGKKTSTTLWTVEAPEDEDYEGVVALGAPDELQAKQNPGVADLLGTLWSTKGGPAQAYNKFFDGVLSMHIRQTVIELDGETPFESQLGTLSPAGAASADRGISTLSLLIKSEPRAAGGHAVAEASEHPEIELAFVAPAGRVSVFSMQAPWDREHIPPDDWYVVAPIEEDYKGTIKIGLGGRPNEVLASLHDSEGNPVKSHTFHVRGAPKLKLPKAYVRFVNDDAPEGDIRGSEMLQLEGVLDLSTQGIHVLGFGHKADNKLEDELRLVAWSASRPETNRAAGADRARIGPATPRDAIDGWLQRQQKRLHATKQREPKGEKMFKVDRLSGVVRLRSGVLFDVREREIAGESDLRRGDDLLLNEGSKACVRSGSSTYVQLSSETGNSAVFFLQPSMWLVPLPHLEHLKVEIDRLPEGGELSIVTLTSISVKANAPAVFQLTGEGKLEVWEGELEVSDKDGDEVTILKAGQEITFPTPPWPGDESTDPNAP